MPRNLISYFVLAVSLVCVPVSAQRKHIAEEPDTVPLFRGVAVSYDLAGTVQRLVSDYGQVEGAVRVNLRDRYFPTLEVGYGMGEHDSDPMAVMHVKTNAPYFRLGCDVNIARKRHDDYRILVGARYAFTSYTFEADAVTTDPVWGTPATYHIEDSGCSCHWLEALFAVDAKMWGPLRMGWSVRYKLKLTDGTTDHGDPWYVPGYGKHSNTLGATFNIMFEL